MRHCAGNSGEKYNVPTPHKVTAVIVIPSKMFRKSVTQNDAFTHIQTVASKQRPNPNALIDVNGYLATNADVAASHLNPLDH